MDFKKIAGYGVLTVGVLWLLGSSTTGSSVNTGSTGSLLVGGGVLPASPTDSGFIITPPATTNYNFMAPQPSDGFFIGASAPADPSTPTSKKSSSRVTSSGRSIDTGQTPNTYDVATGTYTDIRGYGYSMGSAPQGSKTIDSKKQTRIKGSYNWATGTYTDTSGYGYSTATPPQNTLWQFGAGWL